MNIHPATTRADLRRYSPQVGDYGLNFDADSPDLQGGTRPSSMNSQSRPANTAMFVVTTKTTTGKSDSINRVYVFGFPYATQGEESLYSSESCNYLGISERRLLSRDDAPEVLCDLESSPELSSYLINIYALESKGQHRAASKVVFHFIETNFSTEKIGSVNAFMETIDLEKLSPWSISGLLRFTSRARDHLPHWLTTFNQAKKVLASKGYNADNLLVGIGE